jgi:hypothetical protein
MFELLRMAAPVVAALPVVLLVTRRRFIRAFERAHAFVPDRAIPPPVGPLAGWWHSRLTAAGVIREQRNGRLWLDRHGWQSYRSLRRRRALVDLALMLVIAVVWYRRVR